MTYQPHNALAWPYEMPSTWIGEGWIDLSPSGIDLPFFWKGDRPPELYREASQFWRRRPNGGWRLAAAMLETVDDVEMIGELLAAQREPVTLWMSSVAFRDSDKIRRAEAVGTVAVLRAGDLVDLSPLHCFPQLTAFCIEDARVSDLSQLARLRELRALFVSGLECLTNIETLADLPGLRHLQIRHGDYPDLSILGRLHLLESLGLPECVTDDALVEIAKGCRALRRLVCFGAYQLGTLAPLGDFRGLESLEISGSHVHDFSPLERLTALRLLDLFNNDKLESVALVLPMPRLSRLELEGCYALRDFAALQHTPHLNALSLPPLVTQRDIDLIASSCPKLTRLRLDNRENPFDTESISGAALDATSIAGLVELRELRAWLVSLKNIERLGALSQLRKATLKIPADCTDLSFIRRWKEMRWLTLALHSGVTDVSALAELRELQALDIMFGSCDARTLGALDKLISLEIQSCTELTNVEALAQLRGLTTVSITGTPLASLWKVPHDSNLVSLEVTGAQVEDLAPLTGASRLRHLNLDGNEQALDFAPLTTLPNLVKLDISSCGSKCDLSPLRQAPRLAHLRATYCDWLTSADLSLLVGAPRFTSLWLDANERLDDIAPLAKLPALEDLSVGWCSEITDLKPIENLNQLRTLTLSGCDGITDFRPITRLKRLVSLALDMTQIRDISFVPALRDLRCIDLSQCWEIEDISPLIGLRAKGCVVHIAHRQKELEELDSAARARTKTR